MKNLVKIIFTFQIIITIFMFLIFIYFYNNSEVNLEFINRVLFMNLNILLLPFSYFIIRNKINIFNPIYLTNFLYLCYFVLSPYLFFNTHKKFFGISLEPYFKKGNLYFIIGIFFVYIGFFTSYKIKFFTFKFLTFRLKNRKKVKIIKILYLIAFILLIKTSISRGISVLSFTNQLKWELGSSENFIMAIVNMMLICFPVLMLIEKNKKQKIIYFLFYLLYFKVIYSMGFRYRVAIVFFMPLLVIILYKKMKIKIWKIFLFLSIIIIINGFIGQTRDLLRRGQLEFKDLKKIELTKIIETSGLADEIFAPFYGMVENIPKKSNYTYGKSYAFIILGFIPRDLWHEKPSNVAQEMVYKTFENQAMTKSGMAFPNIGEMYINFGIAGINLGMFLLGIFLGKMNILLEKKNKNLREIIMFVFVYVYLIQVISRGYMVTLITTTSITALALFFVPEIVFKKYGKGRRIENKKFKCEYNM